jgi:hypothetical protein
LQSAYQPTSQTIQPIHERIKKEARVRDAEGKAQRPEVFAEEEEYIATDVTPLEQRNGAY